MYASYPMGEYTLAENSGLVKSMADAQTMNELDRITPLGWQGGTADYYNYYQLNKDRILNANASQDSAASAQTGSGEEVPVFAASAKTNEGEPLIIVDVYRVGEDAAVLTSNGRAIPIGQVLFDDYGAQAVYETAAEFPDAVNAKRFLQLYTLSGLPAADFLQMYLDIALDDIQNGETAQGVAGSNQTDIPFGTEDVLPIGALNLSDDTLASIGTLFEQEGVPLPDGMDGILTGNGASSLASVNGNSIIKEDGQPFYTGYAKTLPGLGNVPYRALASAGSVTDVQYVDGSTRFLTDEHGNLFYGDNGDPEMTITNPYPDVTPYFTPKPTPSPTPEPTPTPSATQAPKFTINIFKTGDYERNKNIYQGVTDSTLMPLAYVKQSQAQLKKEGVIYPGDGIIYHGDPELSYDDDQTEGKGEGDRRLETDCVGMLVLPAMMWYSDDMFDYLIEDAKKIKTSSYLAYHSSSHKGRFTQEIIDSEKMFDGMVLMGEDDEGIPEHTVTFYKEFEYEGTLYKNVVVDITGFRYRKDPETGKDIVDKETKDKNSRTEINIRPFDVAYKEGKYKFWCAPDYIDYGDQKDPVTGELLTPKKQSL